LDASPTSKPEYVDLFTRLLDVEYWRAQANISGLIRLLRAYFFKHSNFAQVLQSNMQAIMERVQFVLCNKRTESSGFALINAMFLHLPLEFYQSYLKMLVTVVLTRLQSAKTSKFKKDFTVCMSVLVHRHRTSPALIPQVFEEIQAGLFMQMFPQVWLPSLGLPSMKMDERKVCTLALARLMHHEVIGSNPEVFGRCCMNLIQLLGLLPSTAVGMEDNSDDEHHDCMALEYEATFSKLRNTDLPGCGGGLAPDIPGDAHEPAHALLKPLSSKIAGLASGNSELGILLHWLR
jgi:exportin-2 (importin alpha re-exporter)